MDFYKLVVIIAIVLLIISLAAFGTVFTYGVTDGIFPSYKYKCPDYWSWDGSSCNSSSTMRANLGNSGSITSYTPKDSVCENKKWAKQNGILWDGVSNTSSSCA